jgi:aspartate aminotransferase
MALSHLAETLIGSEIISLAATVKEKIAQGQKIFNYTIGDFDPAIFPVPREFEEAVIRAYREKHTHYPAADGIPELRQAVGTFLNAHEGLSYDPSGEILISAGGRPLIYATYRAIVDRGETVIYTVPSWNNNHYTHFVEGVHQVIETRPENNFMPVAEELKPLLKDATLLALCSPLNPTGTAFSREQLSAICALVLEENNRRTADQKKLYILFDQIYWQLTYGTTQHYHPVALEPALKDYTIYIDGMSKAFAATGVRVGWALGPAPVIGKMKAILSHIGAWSPMPEQKAASRYLIQDKAISQFLEHFKEEIGERLGMIYQGIMQLKALGLPVDAIAPQAALYLTIKLDLRGKTPAGNTLLEDQAAVTDYVLNEAGLAVVPFYAFGTSRESPWYRLSVGTCRKEEITDMLAGLKQALEKLN